MKLATVLKQWRWASKMAVRDAAKEIGIAASTLCRIENGQGCDGCTLSLVLAWLLATEPSEPERETEQQELEVSA